ncbi:AAA family ATPase [Amycolatopsis sp. NPDC051045]|uniref:AAA family ATPase n=1 Tax=Amycolatopsis sp. NPDC051045 TaxID=3156922 RepID=UPI003414CA99
MGPPGVGKTTIARLLADGSNLTFEPVSATFSGVADLRKVFAAAGKRRGIGQGTLLFVDEIHRFNRAQQDSFLLNAPTRLMKDLGYGKDYQYDPDTADGFSGADYFPGGMDRETYYEPTQNGYEIEIAERLRNWAASTRRRNR